MLKRAFIGLFAFFTISILVPAQGYSFFNNLSRIVSPERLQALDSHPAEIIIEFVSDAARPETFKAWLNGNNITDRFEETENGMRASVGPEDGLRVGLEGDPWFQKVNTLGTKVRGPDWERDFDFRVFFVEVGAAAVTVPGLLGLSQADAEAAITAAGLTVGSISEEVRISIPTGVVVGQSPEAGTEVAGGSTVDLVLVQPPPVAPDEAVAPPWVGEWEISISLRPAGSTNAGAVEVVTDAICPDDPLGVALAQEILDASPSVTQASCTGTASDTRLEVSCTATVATTCTLDVTMSFAVELFGSTLAGTGLWTALGNCGPEVTVNDAEQIVVSGVRLNPDPGSLCTSSTSSLMQKFMRHAFILPLVEEGL